MRFFSRWLHNKHEVYITLMVMLFIIVLSLAIFVNNSFFVQYFTSGVKEISYPISVMTTDGYAIQGKKVIATSQSARLTYGGINHSVSRIQINCINELTDSEATSSLSYSTVTNPSTFTSIPFSIIDDDAMVDLKSYVTIANIELSLTNKFNDSVVCENIVLNPTPRFNLSTGRVALYIGILLLTSIVLSAFTDNTLTKLGVTLGSNSGWMFVGILVVIDLLYPIIVTWDSGHYLWLADMFKRGDLANWDPIRNAVYPYSLFLTSTLFGQSQNAYLIPMIIAHCAFYLLCCELIFRVIKLEGVKRLWITFAVFLFIALDPTIVGYYHTLLTEYVASFIAVLSCLMAYDFYISEVGSGKFYKTIVYFCVLIPIMWHVKQPYIGAALFPFMIASTIKMICCRKRILPILVVCTYAAATLLTIASQIAWNNTLRNSGNKMDENRQLSSMAEFSVNKQISLLQQSPLEYLKYLKDQYIASSNYYLLSSWMSEDKIITEPLFIRGFENSSIGQRIFNLDVYTSNLFYAPPYIQYTTSLTFIGITSKSINSYFKSRIGLSDFSFTVVYLLLPLYFLIKVISWFRKKTNQNGLILVLISTAFVNALAHSSFYWLDRYLFYGYPLLLISLGVDVIILLRKLHNLGKNDSNNLANICQ